MRIILMSDLHMSHDGKPIWDTDVKEHLNFCVEKIKQIPDVDVIIIAGDLSNDGSLSSYQMVDNAFDKINIPIYCCAGNHDNILNLQNTLKQIKYIKHTQVNDWHLVFLNTIVPDELDPSTNKARGYLSEIDLYNLEDLLSHNFSNTIIVMHHPAIEPDGWLNRRLLENREQFIQTISKYSHVKMVLMGHSHEYCIRDIEDIKYIISPSIGYAFSAALPKFHIDKGKESFLVIDTKTKEIQKIQL